VASDARPIASLTPTLLARKGGARPVLRSQLQSGPAGDGPSAREADDERTVAEDAGALDDAANGSARVVSIKPAAKVRQRVRPAALERQLAQAIPAHRAGQPADGGTAAFTLRLDADRHLRLRLACALANRSAQSLLTEALDQMLDGLPEVADMAARARRHR
jgi:hypothetical protein